MMAIMGAAAKVDTKDTKKPIQDMWKDAWCGWLNEKMLRLFALFSLRKRRSGWGSGQRDDVGGHGNHEPGGRNFLNGDDEALRQVFNIAPVSAAETENGGVAARGSYLSTGIGNVGGTYSCWAEKADIFRACGARCLPWTLQRKRLTKAIKANDGAFITVPLVKTADLRPHIFDGKCLPRR